MIGTLSSSISVENLWIVDKFVSSVPLVLLTVNKIISHMANVLILQQSTNALKLLYFLIDKVAN